MTSKFPLLLSSSFVALAIASPITSPAFAQEAAPDPAAVELEPIIVEGKLIGEPWYRVGTSFEQLDEEDLEERPGMQTTQDVLGKAANVSAPVATAKAPSIRGVDGTGPAENANAFFAGSRPRMGLNVDGRPASYNELVFGSQSLWDVERVEMLRGPQSTLSGRNAIAGTLSVKSNDPTFEREGRLRASGGSHSQKRISGMVNVPINDIVAFRFSADVGRSESPVKYQSFAGAPNPGLRETMQFRGKMLANLDIADGATLRVTAAHNSHKGPNAERIVRPYSNKVSQFPQQPVHSVRTSSIGAEFEMDINEQMRLELDASLADFRFDRAATTSPAWIDTMEGSIDPRMRFFMENGIEALVGLHYYRAHQDEFIQFMAKQNFDDKTVTKAVYGEVKVPFMQSFELSLGARYEQEKRTRRGGDANGAVATIDSDRTFDAFLPRVGLNWEMNDEQNYGIHISKGYNAGGGGVASGLPLVPYEYDTETVWNFELYGRQSLLDDRLQLTQNVFYSIYDDMQLPYDLTPNDTLDEKFVVRNAEEVITYGAEIGAAYQINEAWKVYGNLGLLKTEIKKFPGSGVQGNELFNAPAKTAALGVNWAQDGFQLGLAARYSDGYYTSINNRPRGKTKGSVIADANASYDFGNMRLFAEVKNIFDNQDAVAIYPGATSSADSAVLQQERMFNFGLEAKF
jgi:outer membrane receptor protein involved in Fe transport